ncbi:hypothetical protein DXG01_003525 [Tephrocybe rancida]|nr:hypothetical protein DXG01_003525 [Tephrocybe rancida]
MAQDPEKNVAEAVTRDASISDATPMARNPTLEKTWRKIDIVILPVVAMFYLLSFLDRTNLASSVGNARAAGLQEDLKMTNYQYSIALTVTFIPYIAIKIPSNRVLNVRGPPGSVHDEAVGPGLMLPMMMTLWGIVTTLQGLVTSYSGLLACRFFLGLFEGGVFPGFVLYLSFWYPRQQLQRRISAFFSTVSLSGAFSGILAYGIIHMDGLFTLVFGISAFFVLPSSPETARFLTAEEKDYVLTQLRDTGATGFEESADAFSWSEVGRALTLPQMWMVAVIFFFNGAQIYGLAYFTPSIIHGLGYSKAAAQLYSVPPFGVAFVATITGAYISDRFGARGFVTMLSGIVSTIGFAVFLVSTSFHVKWGSLFLTISGAYNAAPALSTWSANNASPYTRRAVSIAIGIGFSNSGGILVTWLLGTLSPAPLYREATITLLIFSVLIVIITGMNIAYLATQNKKKAVIRAATSRDDEKPGLGDRSAWFVYSL